MTFDELNLLNIECELGYAITMFNPTNSIISLNNKICIPIVLIDPSISAPSQITVKNSDGIIIGEICIGVGIGFDQIYPLSEYFNIAYLIDVDKDHYKVNALKTNYLVIDSDFYDEYMTNYYQNAHFSGIFSHQDLQNRNHICNHEVVLKNGYTKKNAMQVENSLRSILLPFSFEKYLKYYHNLELQFDHAIFEKIRNLNPDMNGFAEIMSSYKRDDIERLSYLFDDIVMDYASFLPLLNNMLNHQKSYDILIKFGKDKNPLVTDKMNRYNLIKSKGNFSNETLRTINININDYENFLKKTIVYCIYRFRCCIAHNKIGEYVMTLLDEEYVDNVCLPLLKEACYQIMR